MFPTVTKYIDFKWNLNVNSDSVQLCTDRMPIITSASEDNVFIGVVLCTTLAVFPKHCRIIHMLLPWLLLSEYAGNVIANLWWEGMFRIIIWMHTSSFWGLSPQQISRAALFRLAILHKQLKFLNYLNWTFFHSSLLYETLLYLIIRACILHVTPIFNICLKK